MALQQVTQSTAVPNVASERTWQDNNEGKQSIGNSHADILVSQRVKSPIPTLVIDGIDNESVPISLSTASPPSSPDTASDDVLTMGARPGRLGDTEPLSPIVQGETGHFPFVVTMPRNNPGENNASGTRSTGPVATFYRGKNILLTGATGFIGKAILWKLMSAVGPELGKIYILMRNGGSKRTRLGRSSERLKNEVLNNKAFVTLRTQLGGAKFDAMVKKHLIPVNADIVSPDLSLSEKDHDALTKNVQVVIHCAASIDCDERLDLAIETNTLGTLRLMDLAKECVNMEAFVYTSLAYRDAAISGERIQERVYPMELGDPNDVLNEIVSLELPDLPKMTQRILAYYPNIYTFTKVLTEHLILKRADINRIEEAQGGKPQWPIAIVRATQVGAAVSEPLPGWVDGVTGMNGAVFLLGHGVHVLQQDSGHVPADIVPVDYLTRIVLGCPAFMSPPGTKFMLAYNEIVKEPVGLDQTSSLLSHPSVPCFPLIYQVSGNALHPVPWSDIYDAIRHYWARTTRITLPVKSEYFVSKSLFKKRVFAKNQLSQSLVSVAASVNSSTSVTAQYGARSTSKPTVRTVELASRINQVNQPFLRRQWNFDTLNTNHLISSLETDDLFILSSFEKLDWFTYMVEYSYGVHRFIGHGPPELRSIALPPGWDCALYPQHNGFGKFIMDKQIESVVYSPAEIKKRMDRMVTQIIEVLEHPDGPELLDKKKRDAWINDFDASLDDWCHDDSEILQDAKQQAILGRWGSHMNDEAVKVTVLNDKRVAESVRQIIENSRIPTQTAIDEAFKILQRMRERTRLPYICFAGSLLDALFKRLFVSIRISEDSIAKLRHDITDKNVVYVSTSKTILDQLLLWYVCLRYQLPLPAIVCDEALALLGPLSDIFRITGAYFVRRDPSNRSPLITSVTAAYTELLLHEHGALSILIEKTRSRTGRIQTAYHDGVIGMLLDAALERHQQATESITSTPKSPRPRRSNSLSAKSHQETVFVPINITHENIPEIHILIDQVLDQKQPRSNDDTPTPPTSPTTSTFLRPSAKVAGRAAIKESKWTESGKYGRVYVGIGKVFDVQESAAKSGNTLDKCEEFIHTATTTIQKRHYECANVGPVALVAAAILFGRLSGGITMSDLHEHVRWLRDLVLSKGIPLDWQDHEDVETMVVYALQLMDARKNITTDGKRVTDATIIRVIEHADNVMVLSYMSNQLVDILLSEAIFSIVYLSTRSEIVTRSELEEGFNFLIRLFKGEFIYPWDKDEKFAQLVHWFEAMAFLDIQNKTTFKKNTALDKYPLAHTHICLMASLLYPTLDAYWITSCSLSALRDLPYLPRKIVPLLAQWVAAHLISGRRTIYREVLSTDAMQNALDNYLGSGLIEAVHPKTQLSPEAQILLLELGVTTNEDLVMVPKQNADATHDHKSNNGVADIASLCSAIEKFRFGANAQRETFKHNAQVFDKCQNQIRSILRADTSYAKQHDMDLNNEEDQMIQLVYTLKTSASSNASTSSEIISGRNPRRVSQAYNLVKP